MLNQIKKWLLPFFSLNKSEQRGVLFLSLIIVLIVVVNFLMPFFVSPEKDQNNAEFKREVSLFKQAQQKMKDSMEVIKLQNSGQISIEIARQKIRPKAFDPNKLPEEEWLAMGFTPNQVSTIKKYEAKGGKFNRKEDVKKLYSISEAEYNIIEPYIIIKSEFKSTPGKSNKKASKSAKHTFLVTDINVENAETIEKNLDINPWLANRITDYRELIGGYYAANQLKEVYGMKPEIFEAIEPWVSFDTNYLKKIDLNKVAFKELLKHPYMDFESTKAIVGTRDKIKSFQSLDDVSIIEGINDTILLKMLPYFEIKR